MDEEFVQVKVVTRTGQQTAFSASEMEKTHDGYRFFSFPERRGYKKLIVVKDDAIATISIEAPEPFFKTMDYSAAANVVGIPAALPAAYPGGDPSRRAPEEWVNPIAEARREEGRNALRAMPLKNENNTPAAIVKETLKDGSTREIPVNAAMVRG